MTFFNKLLAITLFLFCSGFSESSYSAATEEDGLEEASTRFRKGHRNVADVFLLATKSEANQDAKYYLADQILKGESESFTVSNEAFSEDIRGNRAKVMASILRTTDGDDSECYFKMLEDMDAGVDGYGNARKRLMAILNTEAQAEGDEREDDDYRLAALEVFFEGLASQGPAA